jgi:hypothetical protein
MALTDDLMAFWELEEASGTRSDAHGANDLTDNNTVTSVTGKVGNAADLERGNSEYLSITDNAALSMGVNQSFTINAWVKVRDSFSDGCIVSKMAANGEYSLHYLSGGFRIRTWSSATYGGQSSKDDSANGAPSLATWYMVTAGYDADADELFIYRNAGGLVTLASVTSGAMDSGSTFCIGAQAAPSIFFDGAIDQVGVWKRRLDGSEITELYNSGSGLDYAGMGGGGGGGGTTLGKLTMLGVG